MVVSFFFFFNDTATTEIYTLSLHDALPISKLSSTFSPPARTPSATSTGSETTFPPLRDRKSTRLNSSHSQISYAVFCLKKKKNADQPIEVSTDTDDRHATRKFVHRVNP